MTAASPVDSPRSDTRRQNRSLTILRIIFLLIAVTLGLIQAWVTRFAMNPDGVSYLDIGDRLWRGDLHALLNGYWSPLYGSLLGLAMAIVKPSSYWEFAVVHFVNFFIYLLGLLCFDFFLREFIKSRKRDEEAVLPESVWLAIGYLLFISSSLLLINLGIVSPDMCVATCVYLAAALLLRIRANPVRKVNFILLGCTLGVGYWSKTVMFPLSFVVLSVMFIMVRGWRRANRKSLLALIAFLVIAAPLVLALSWSKRRPTFGDSGKLNYAWEVNQIPKYVNWQGEPQGSGVPRHPTRQILSRPTIFEFAAPIPGSYPPWFDPSYWYEGVRTRMEFGRQLEVLGHWIMVCSSNLVDLCGGLFAVVFLLLMMNRRRWSPRRMARSSWFLLLPAVVAMLIYSLVFVSPRYIASFEVLLWFSIFSGLQPGRPGSRRWFDYLAVCLAIVFVYAAQPQPPFAETMRSFRQGTPDPQPEQWRIANGLNQMGVQPGDKVASLGGALFPHWYRLAHVQVAAEIPAGQNGVIAFWQAEPAVREQVMKLLAQAGARAVIIDKATAGQDMDGWQKIADTDAYVYFLRDR
jgi:hypothetical protein